MEISFSIIRSITLELSITVTPDNEGLIILAVSFIGAGGALLDAVLSSPEIEGARSACIVIFVL